MDAIKNKDWVRLAENNRRFVQRRLDNERHWFRLMAMAKENIDARKAGEKAVYKSLAGDKHPDLPAYAYIYYRKVFDPAFVAEPIDMDKSALIDYLVNKFPEEVRPVVRENIKSTLAPLIADTTSYESYRLIRMLIDQHGIEALTSGEVNMYNYGEIKEAMKRADAYNKEHSTHLVLFMGGAGGPYSVCAAFCPEGMEHVKAFMKALDIPEADAGNMAEAQEMLEGKKSGSFKLGAPMVTGDENPGIQWTGLAEAGLKPVNPAPQASVSIVTAQDKETTSLPQPRNGRGQFAERPGKSWTDAMDVIAMSELCNKGQFTLADYLAAYEEVRKGHPELSLDPLAANPDRTARRDMADLIEKGYVDVASKSPGQATRFSLTRAGALEAEYRVERDRIVIARSDDMATMATLASEKGPGMIPTRQDARYTLFLPAEFFANGEFEAHRATYGDRFNLEKATGQTTGQMVKNVLAKARGIEKRAIVLISNETPESELKELTDAGVRFLRVDIATLREARDSAKPDVRAAEQVNTYAIMLLVRVLDAKMDPANPVYQLLRFYVKESFKLEDKMAVDDYINALANDDISRLIKGILNFLPTERYQAPDYNTIAAALISA